MEISGSPSFAGKTMTVNTHVDGADGRSDIAWPNRHLFQVLPDQTVSMGVLVGDTTGNGTVSASDIAQVKSKSGQTTDASNFRTDVNVSGGINASDIGLVKSKAGTGLP